MRCWWCGFGKSRNSHRAHTTRIRSWDAEFGAALVVFIKYIEFSIEISVVMVMTLTFLYHVLHTCSAASGSRCVSSRGTVNCIFLGLPVSMVVSDLFWGKVEDDLMKCSPYGRRVSLSEGVWHRGWSEVQMEKITKTCLSDWWLLFTLIFFFFFKSFSLIFGTFFPLWFTLRSSLLYSAPAGVSSGFTPLSLCLTRKEGQSWLGTPLLRCHSPHGCSPSR